MINKYTIGFLLFSMAFTTSCINYDRDYIPTNDPSRVIEIKQASYIMTSHDFMTITFDKAGNRINFPDLVPNKRGTTTPKTATEIYNELKKDSIIEQADKKIFIFSADADYLYTRLDSEIKNIQTSKIINEFANSDKIERLKKILFKYKMILTELESANYKKADGTAKRAEIQALIGDLETYNKTFKEGL